MENKDYVSLYEGLRVCNDEREAAPIQGHSLAAAPGQSCVAAQEMKVLSNCPIEGMPWDVLIEVFQHSHPRDLLSLARTTRTLRGFLISRKSAHIWRTSRRSLTIPDCPSELSEPQYAALLFTSECTVCGEPGVMNAQWELLGRYCPSCSDSRLIQFREAREILSIVPGVGGLWSEPFLFGDNRYHSPSAMCIRKQVNEFRDLWLACHTHQEQTQLREKFAAEYLRREQFISAIEHFAHSEEERRRKELTEIRKVRVQSIIDRLRVGGWEEELDSMTESRMRQLCRLDIVYRTVPLTESAWNDMQKPLTEFMELTRAHRLWLAAVRLRLRWLQDIAKEYNFSIGRRKGPGGSAGSDMRVHFSDIATLHEVRTLLEAPVADDVKQESIAKLCDDMLATLPEKWIQQQQPLFDDLVKQTPRASTLSDGALATLAIVTYNCTECNCKGLRWPHVLAHTCGLEAPVPRKTYNDHPEEPLTFLDILKLFCAEHGLIPPCRRELSFKVRFAPEITETMIRACGFDPLKATYAELRDSGVRLYCNMCAVPAIGYIEVYDWQNAMCHSHLGCGTKGRHGRRPYREASAAGNWRILDAETTALVVALEAARREAGTGRPFTDELYQCIRCDTKTCKSIIFHCVQVHQVEEPKIGRDFYVVPRVEDGVAWHDAILVYPEDALRTNRKAARDVAQGIAILSPVLFRDRSE
ncbi:hypothetical protein PYCCODRAFT_1474173 [Trametes coccinea BRFM310]|uniref:F-box domain-containing protein n=1 Tax=Trametes coccinea (strain BRFM310) TaxID=1353009 RepID=A0A1Y2J037_TRAC3|nr:hypothetical protein PYCCODRAFT_1474173 [Trametes coccinea BRFM310]